MRRAPWLSVVLGAVVAFLVTAAPARASESHCGEQAAQAAPRHEHAVPSPATDEVRSAEHQGCPECPTRACSLLHGCSAVAPCLDASPVQVAVAAPLARRPMLPQDLALPSFVSSPPTPPPNSVLSIPA